MTFGSKWSNWPKNYINILINLSCNNMEHYINNLPAKFYYIQCVKSQGHRKRLQWTLRRFTFCLWSSDKKIETGL